MANWRYRLNIANIFNAMGEGKYDPETDPEGAGRAMAALLRKHEKRIHNVGRLAGFPVERFAGRFERARSLAALQNTLNDMTDYCDTFLIWLETFDKRSASGPIEYRIVRYDKGGSHRWRIAGPDGRVQFTGGGQRTVWRRAS